MAYQYYTSGKTMISLWKLHLLTTADEIGDVSNLIRTCLVSSLPTRVTRASTREDANFKFSRFLAAAFLCLQILQKAKVLQRLKFISGDLQTILQIVFTA